MAARILNSGNYYTDLNVSTNFHRLKQEIGEILTGNFLWQNRLNVLDYRFVRPAALVMLGTLLLTSACAKKEAAEKVYPKNYREILAASKVIEIHGETADSAKLEGDKYLFDNLDYILTNNRRVAVNFGAYWCKDCYKFDPYFREAAARPEYADVLFAHAECDGTKGNENFRSRFELPGVPVVMLFENGQPVEKEGRRGILFGENGDKTKTDLEVLLKTFFGS